MASLNGRGGWGAETSPDLQAEQGPEGGKPMSASGVRQTRSGREGAGVLGSFGNRAFVSVGLSREAGGCGGSKGPHGSGSLRA